MELISIIVPVFNMGQTVERCVDSLRRQTYPNLEIILVDDGSTDASARLCDSFAERDVRVKVIHQANKGVSAARNAALTAAAGSYVGFVDADDYVDPDMFELLASEMEQDDSVDLAVCRVYCEGDRHSPGQVLEERTLTREKAMRSLFERNGIRGYLWNKLFKAELIRSLRLTVREDIAFCEDSVFCFDYVSHIRAAACLPERKYHYVWDRPGASSAPFSEKNMTVFTAYDYLLTKGAETGDENLMDILRCNYVRHCITVGHKLLKTGGKAPRADSYLKILQKGAEKYGKVFLSSGGVSVRHKLEWILFLYFPGILKII